MKLIFLFVLLFVLVVGGCRLVFESTPGQLVGGNVSGNVTLPSVSVSLPGLDEAFPSSSEIVQPVGGGVKVAVQTLYETPNASAPRNETAPSRRVVVHSSRGVSYEYFVEIADEYVEQQRGLMFREQLDVDRGMFFIFKGEATLNFWMKNTLIPLDIIFIDRNLRIINWVEAQPCRAGPCPQYYSAGPAQYVLEVNQGQMAQYGLKMGDSVELVAGSTP